MMSRLTEYGAKPPEAVMIDGVEHMLDSHFRNCLLTLQALLDDELTGDEKADILIGNMYNEPRPVNTGEAMRLAVNYLLQNREHSKEDHNSPAAIDFWQDGQFIYDAFLLKGINLDKSDMTYWEFLAHLRELPEGCMLSRLVHWRLTPRSKLTKEERAQIDKIGHDVVYLKKRHDAEQAA